MVSTLVSIPGYRIYDLLYNGSRTLVYRGYRETDSLPVVMKLLKNPYPSFSEILSFRNQYTIAKNLNSPLIVQTYSLEPYQNGYALVMEDFGGISLKNYFTSPEMPYIASGEEFLQIAIALCNTLDILYRERIIHKDIKPANILINPETKQVKLIDFSIASLLPRETQTLINLNVLEGTLAYISPEQTGRMNRGIDYRTDFYSLGVTFYQLLTGVLPFQSNVPMELVHSHIAKPAPLVHEINPQIPSVISEIVSKLMAKNAEDRYQSALGLKFDLENCLHQLQVDGVIRNFEIAQRDVCDRFLLREKLYGREQEVKALLDAFGRVANGAVELMLVAGFSGIGKTAVVNEVHKPIVRWNGYFIKGKYDQFNRNIPLSAFVQAFRDLMAQLLSQSDTQLEQWRNKILSALGESGQVMIEVIPELERIIGKQPPAPELSGSAAQNRFNMVFVKFIQVFTTPEHPLVVFLDDLQWADSASLNLMMLLMGETLRGYLFIIGAYRDNEVFAAHPLMLNLEEIEKVATVNTLTLTNLSQPDVNSLIADSLTCSTEVALPLTELVYQKAKGNPFFTTQFLKALHEDGRITFDWHTGFWQCDVAQVRSLALTDDVVEFMAVQLLKLPIQTQAVLKLAACIGNQFDLSTLAIVCEQSETETATHLWKALQEGLVIPQSEVYKFYQTTELGTSNVKPNNHNCAYKFLHDRVQQAAYSLIPQNQKQATHLKIGQLLLHNTSSAAIEANIFEIVNQLNEGIGLIIQQSEKPEIAQLNLIAGRKAKAATAYKAAVKYFALGIDLLPENSWECHYSLAFGLYRERAECEYLTGNLNDAENLFDLALINAQDKFEKAEIYAIKMYLKMTKGENIQAGFEAGLQGLSIMGMELPLTIEEQQTAIKTELEELKIKLETVYPADLFALPEMTDPVKKVCMSLLADLWAAAYMGGHQYLSYLSLLLMINTSLKYGNADGSGFAYCLYGMSLANQGDYQTAYKFGKLALKLDRHLKSAKFIYKTNNIFAHTINPYNQHLKTNLPLSRQSFQTSGEAGDVVFGVWAVSFLIWAMLVKGDRLADIYAETEKYLSYVQQVNDVNMLYAFTLQRQFLLNLQDFSQNTDLLDEPNDQNPAYIEVWRQKKNFEHGINWYCFLKLQLLYLYGRFADAVKAAEEAKKTLAANAGFFPIIQYYFYYPLSLTALYSAATSEEKKQYWNVLEQHQQIVKNWADNCPENFLHRYLLLSAEMAQLSSRCMEAIDYYDRAIAQAKENDYIQEEALANELASKFYLNWGKERIAQEYMTQAYYGYARWGAKAKVADLEKRYPQLLAHILQQIPSPLSANETIFVLGSVTSTSCATSSSNNVSVALDLATILKASQTLSGEIELEKLLSALLHIVIENAGADKCVFMLLESDRLLIQASAQLSQNAVDFYPMLLNPQCVEDSPDVPIGLINVVKRSLQPAVIIDGRVDRQLINDPYIQQQQPKSILCSPILHQGKLLGILYLENNLATGAFTNERVELLNLLCAQAAISLENARLYSLSLENAQQLERSLDELSAAQSCLQASQQRLQLLVQQTPLAFIEWDTNLLVTHWNPAAERIFGYTKQEALGRQFQFIIPETIQPQMEEVGINLLSQQGGNYSVNENITKDGRTIICAWYNNPLVNADGELIGVASLTDDITGRKKAELALQQKSQDLQQALQDLQQAQLQMVQSEKMSALGNLVAGVAHEMNNPLGFIAASIKQTKPTIADITEHLKLYQETFPNPSEEIQVHAEEIDLDYTLEDLPKMIDSMSMACDRLKNISTSLRTFSRADRDYKVPFNIHQGIDSTILILKHRLKTNEQRAAIEVVTNYGELPQVECFPGQLNQVFMNILANAIDALEESNTGRSFEEIKANPNRIKIKTSVENESVKIAISDNGKGMSEQVKSKIFDHLFTTKTVGKGTGLGLAIARQIVEETHGGKLSFNSVIGEGTEFIIEIPV
ncbi:AAA family ATPase [Calothrix sp. PCC 7507]|uniref:ATP-binding sensor histidine kinase n=1 Tax=Calothrix sp. PCC 7507 TaxID=99598 RepID=UPI00029EFA3F|nr:AAA family ATPase [Calothrix sp. PCC 7507]AFY36420.1 multi-sensor signal transduction multi-kinase [Calothrix sp. PCC 7507]